MKNLNQKVLSTLIAITAVVGMSNAEKAQYFPSTETYNPNQTYQSDYQERMNTQDRRHQQYLDLIWY